MIWIRPLVFNWIASRVSVTSMRSKSEPRSLRQSVPYEAIERELYITIASGASLAGLVVDQLVVPTGEPIDAIDAAAEAVRADRE